MKSVLSALVLTLSFAAPALATSPIYTPRPILKISTGGGFYPYGVLSNEITLSEDGSVGQVEHIRDQGSEEIRVEENKLSWYFEPEVMHKIQVARTLLEKAGRLVDLDAKAPICMDAPTTTLRNVVYGKATPIAQLSGCHTSLPANAKQKRAAKYLFETMKNLARAIRSQPR